MDKILSISSNVHNTARFLADADQVRQKICNFEPYFGADLVLTA
jgi:hypothetical protein